MTQLSPYNGQSGAPQHTTYYYEDPVNASLVTHTAYPDSSSTPSAGSDLVKVEYNRDGSRKKLTDQRGVIREFSYNARRQLELDDATTLPGGVDGHVKSIKHAYDALGRFLAVHSYAGNGGTGQIRNAVWASHEEMGNLQKLWQSHEGAGSYESTLWTWHKYDSGGTNGVVHNQGRLGELYYPNGAILEYRVGTHASGSWTNPDNYQDRLGQATLLKFTPAGGGAQDVVAYKYNGASRLVLTDYVGPGVRRDMFDRGEEKGTGVIAINDSRPLFIVLLSVISRVPIGG